MSRVIHAIAVLVVAGLLVSSAQAATMDVKNGSFETYTASHPYILDSYDGWDTAGGDTTGTVAYDTTRALDGANSAWLPWYTPDDLDYYPGGVFQMITDAPGTTQQVYQLGTYTFTGWILNYGEGDIRAIEAHFLATSTPGTTADESLSIASTVWSSVPGGGTNAGSVPHPGGNLWTQHTFTLDTTALGFSHLGEYIGIGVNGASASEGSFDMLQLQFTPIPEPMSLMLMGMGGVLMMARRRRAA